MQITQHNCIEILMVIPPIFVLLGLFDVWVPKETMLRLMGERSGIIGVVIAFGLGSVAAGPLYAAFPIAGLLMKKGCRLSNIIIFIGAWSTTKVPQLLFETSTMGWQFMLTRLIIDIPIIIAIAWITERCLTDSEKQLIYQKAQSY
jgi:uncharacterized membrane protein YraQ (UPF0718 family)